MLLDRVLGLAAILVAIPVGLAARGFEVGSVGSPGAGFWPLLIALCIAGLGATLALRPDQSFRSLASDGSQWRNFFLALLSLAGFILALEPVGYVITTGAFLLVQLRWVERCRWRVSLLTALSAAVLSFGVFRVFLKVPLPIGILPVPPGW